MDKKKQAAGYTLIIAGVTAIVCLFAFVFLGYRFVLKPNVEFEAEQTLGRTTAETGTIAIPGFETWTVDAGKTKVSTHFYDPEKNTCYFVISVTLDDTGETIYRSKYIRPGQHLYEVELSRALAAGSYKATLHYSTYAVTDLAPMNGADVPFTLVAN